MNITLSTLAWINYIYGWKYLHFSDAISSQVNIFILTNMFSRQSCEINNKLTISHEPYFVILPCINYIYDWKYLLEHWLFSDAIGSEVNIFILTIMFNKQTCQINNKITTSHEHYFDTLACINYICDWKYSLEIWQDPKKQYIMFISGRNSRLINWKNNSETFPKLTAGRGTFVSK